MATARELERVRGYERFLGLNEPPFSLAPNTRFRFESASHTAALDQVAYALARREPLVVLTGEIGTGKTLLCRTVLERLERKTFLSVINDPLLERDELLKQMLQDFGVISKDRTKLPPTSRHDLIHALQEFLASLAPLQAHAVLIIDEAQHVQADVMEQIRLLSNIHDERGTMLQIILVGQLDLESKLARPELGQLKQRVSRRLRLESLSAAEVAQYVEHRLTVARRGPTRSQVPGAFELERAIAEWEGPRVEFAPEAIGAVARLSRGIPRVVNLLCDRALEAAYERQVRIVDVAAIDAAARALDLPDVPEPAASPVRVQPAAPTQWTEPVAPIEWTVPGAPTQLTVPAVTTVPAVATGPTLSAGATPKTERTEATGAVEPSELTRGIELGESSAPADLSETTDETVPVAFGASMPTPVGSGGSRSLVLAASVALVLVAAGIGGLMVSRSRDAEPQVQAPPSPASRPPAATSAPSPSAAASAAAPAASQIETPPATASPLDASPPAQTASDTPPGPSTGETFEIVVASFRTASRAAAVATELEALGQPVRRRVASGWQQVLAGPFASRAQADAAQERLDRAGFTDTQIVPSAR